MGKTRLTPTKANATYPDLPEPITNCTAGYDEVEISTNSGYISTSGTPCPPDIRAFWKVDGMGEVLVFGTAEQARKFARALLEHADALERHQQAYDDLETLWESHQ